MLDLEGVLLKNWLNNFFNKNPKKEIKKEIKKDANYYAEITNEYLRKKEAEKEEEKARRREKNREYILAGIENEANEGSREFKFFYFYFRFLGDTERQKKQFEDTKKEKEWLEENGFKFEIYTEKIGEKDTEFIKISW